MSAGQEVGEIFGSGTGPATALLRSPTVIIASIGLWGMNIYFFRLFGIDYVKVLNGGKDPYLSTDPSSENSGKSNTATETEYIPKSENGKGTQQELSQTAKGRQSKGDSKSTVTVPSDDKVVTVPAPSPITSCPGAEVTAGKCISLCIILYALLHLIEFMWIDVLKGGTIGAIFAFYATVAFGIALPLHQTQWIRIAVGTVVYRGLELLNPRCSCIGHVPPTPVPFVDVFFADAMCSLSKVFFDM